MPRRLVCILLLTLSFLGSTVRPTRAYRPPLLAPLCALVTGQVICYDAPGATAHAISPAGQPVTDFAMAPDGNWLVYRVENTVTIAATDTSGQQNLQIDTHATPPAALDLSASTIAWSPDGVAIAYVTAGGFRVAFPAPSGEPYFVDVTDRLAVNLRFSISGARLAVQADDGSWSLFTVQFADDGKGSLHRTWTIDQAADVAWLDDNRLVVAAVAGGLSRLDMANPAQAPAWTVPDEHFTKLFTTSSGQVLALHPDPGDTIGQVVAIDGDGKITALGESKIDSQAQWGPDGASLYYITSGTPILIDRSTGAEETLPLKRILRLAWLPPLPPLSSSIPLDSDLYFLAPDSTGIRQVWLLPRSGLDPVVQVTHQSADVQDFTVDRKDGLIVLTSAQERTALSLSNALSGTVTPLPPPPAYTPTPPLASVEVSGDRSHLQWTIVMRQVGASRLLVQSAWPILDMQPASVISGSSLLFLRRVGWVPGPAVIQLCGSSADATQPAVRSRFHVLSNARLSPTGRFVAGLQHEGKINQLIIIELQSAHRVRIQGTFDISSLRWVL